MRYSADTEGASAELKACAMSGGYRAPFDDSDTDDEELPDITGSRSAERWFGGARERH